MGTPWLEASRPGVWWLTGDVFEQVARIPDNSIDLVMTSPPFLNLRSYLPQDHPHKSLEIGSEATPADFVDAMLDVVEACGRVLTPTGSLVFEIGDSYSGSGGAGGDYADDGWRKGQQRFGGSASKSRESRWDYSEAKWLAGVIDTEGSIQVRRMSHGEGRTPSYVPAIAVTMMDRQVCDRAAEMTGVGLVYFDENRRCFTWAVTAQQARYVLLHIWPYLLIKQRQAKAGIELARHVEEAEHRGRYAPVSAVDVTYREMIREHVKGWNARGEERGTHIDTWEPPTPERVKLGLVGGNGWPMDKSLALIPQSFAWALAYGRNPFNGRETERWRIRNVVAWARPNPPVGALADKFRPATSYLTVATKARDRWFDMEAVRVPYKFPDQVRPALSNFKNSDDTNKDSLGEFRAADGAGAPLLDYWEIPTQPYVTPSGLVVVPSGESVHRVRVPVGAGADGIQRTTSPDCPLHGSSDRLGSSDADGGHAGSESTRSGRNDGGPALARVGDSPPTPSRADQFGSSASPAGPAAIPRSKPSSRTARALATSPVGTPSAQKFADIADTPTSPESSAPDPGTAASSTALVGSDVGRLDTSFRTADNGKGASPCTCSYWVDVSVTSEPSRDYAELPDYWIIPTQPFRGAHYATFGEEIPRRVILSMCPQSVCRVCGEPRRRITETTFEPNRSTNGPQSIERKHLDGGSAGFGVRADRVTETTGWTDCGHGGDWRPGVVLDPFAGSGTTGFMSFGNGRSAVLVDLDERNLDLARDRIGPLFFEEWV